MSRWNRKNFTKTELVDDSLEMDLANNYFNELFQIKRPMRYYSIEKKDLRNPDLLSLTFYKKIDFWWIICRYNNIDDVWNDMVVGTVIHVPDIADIEDFYTEVKKQKRIENR